MGTTEKVKEGMSEYTRELGKVLKVQLFREDRGTLTLMVDVGFRNGVQGLGGWALDRWDEKRGRRVGMSNGTDLICRLLDLFNVQSLEKIQGRYVYALRDSSSALVGLELPEPDGGTRFLISDWLADGERAEKGQSKG